MVSMVEPVEVKIVWQIVDLIECSQCWNKLYVGNANKIYQL